MMADLVDEDVAHEMAERVAAEVDDGRPLPEDPVEALGELKRRAGEHP